MDKCSEKGKGSAATGKPVRTTTQEVLYSVGSLFENLFEGAVDFFDTTSYSSKDVSVACRDIAKRLGNTSVPTDSVTVQLLHMRTVCINSVR